MSHVTDIAMVNDFLGSYRYIVRVIASLSLYEPFCGQKKKNGESEGGVEWVGGSRRGWRIVVEPNMGYLRGITNYKLHR